MLPTTIVPLQISKFAYTLKSKIRYYIYCLVICIISYLFSVITIASFLSYLETSLVAQMVKCLPTVRENRVWSLGREDPLENEMATHSSTLGWKIHGWRSRQATVHGVAKSQARLSDFTFTFHILIYLTNIWWLLENIFIYFFKLLKGWGIVDVQYYISFRFIT